jgi:hypothetical protein
MEPSQNPGNPQFCLSSVSLNYANVADSLHDDLPFVERTCSTAHKRTHNIMPDELIMNVAEHNTLLYYYRKMIMSRNDETKSLVANTNLIMKH